jgi:hypothetical protein
MKMNLQYKKTVLYLFLFFSFTIYSFAQPKKCKEPLINIASQQMAETWAVQRSPLAVNKLIRVYFHILRSDDGSYGEAATLAQIDEEFADLVEDYAPYNICFANVGVDYINNTEINYNLNPDVQSDVDMLLPFLVPNCINIFYHRALGDYGGNAYDIPNTFCSIDDNNIGVWRTISHEVGHCLGLRHTFSTGDGKEYINGTSCSTRGDRVCDTQADPYTESACFSSTSCNYTGNCQDPSGATNYSPPYQNIMSYWGAEGCTVTHFTTGQYARATSFLETDAGLLNTVSPATVTAGPGTVSSGYYFRTARNSITINPTLNITGTAISSLQSQSVTVPPGFQALPTTGSTTIKATCVY